jgi:N-acyl-D-amino-acid deacylase
VFDLLIRGGLLIDGTGNPGFYGAVGIEGEVMRILRGDSSAVEAAHVIDARGLVVCPGFIDMHAHSSLMLLNEPRHEPKVRQGITTEVVGVDGNSYAPFPSVAGLRRFAELNAGLEGDLPAGAEWLSVADYMVALDRHVTPNVAVLIGNSALRVCGVGWEKRSATKDEIEEMKSALREGLEQGAFGMSTGLDYQPGSFASTDELVALSRELARVGAIYHTHPRYRLGDRYLDPWLEAVEIGRRSGAPVHLTHFFQRLGSPGGADKLLDLVDAARAEGLDVTFDTFPYILSSTRLLLHFPTWVQEEGSPEEVKDRLKAPDVRERLRNEVDPLGVSWQEIWLTNFKRPANRKYEGRSVAEIAAMRGTHVSDAMCDLLIDEDLRICRVTPGGNGNTLPKFVSHPLSMVGTDAILLGAFPSPRTYGSFVLILGDFVREDGFLSLPEAIRKMTSFPAQRLGLTKRGALRDGLQADVVVFDPRTVAARATRTNPRQFPIGVPYVIVNGQLVINQGKHTGVLAGRALQRGAC